MIDPAHECKPPVGGALGALWRCECDRLWRVYKAIVFDYDPNNKGWFPAGPVVKIKNTIRRQELAWVQ